MSNNEQLPAKVVEQIKTNAALRAYHNEGKDDSSFTNGYYSGYITGATEWAQWKVKYDELKERCEKYDEVLSQVWLSAKPANEREMISWIQTAQQLCAEALAWKGKEVEPVKEIEYMPVHSEDARKPDCPKRFPMHLLNENQAYSNHGQTLKRLKERGGLGVTAILAIVHQKKWSYYGNLKWEEALKMLNEILTNPIK